jgi:GNAT superfamily N-acetyltransferase
MSVPALIRPASDPQPADPTATAATTTALDLTGGPRVETLTEVPTDLVESFLGVYRKAFAPLEIRAAARQALTDDEFREEMADARVLKFVAYDEAGAAAGLAFMATDLSIVPWVSVPYYAHRFPDHYARGAIFYVGALLVRPDRQGGPWMKALVDTMITHVATNRGIAAFDCCGFNTDVVKLPDTLARATHTLAYAETVEIDNQRYYAYEMAGLR